MKDNEEFKWRVIASLGFLVGAKVLNVQVPFLFKLAVDWLNTASGDVAALASFSAANSTLLALFATSASVLIGYGIAHSGASAFHELRTAVFSKVALWTIRSVSRKVFSHLHKLDLQYHLSREFGALNRIIDRGSRAINFILSSMVFNVVPTILEISTVSGILAYKFGAPFAWIASLFYCCICLLYIVCDTVDMDLYISDDSGKEEEEEFGEVDVQDLGEDFLQKFCKEASMSFFDEHGLISHQINSYNDFIKSGVQRVFDSFPELTVEPGYDPSKKGEDEWRYASVRFDKVTLDSPTFWGGTEKDKEHNMLPRHARLQNMTYSSKMKVDVHVEVYSKSLKRSDKFKTGEEQYLDREVISSEDKNVMVGRIPVMVMSDLCWMKETEKRDCDFDDGGYFIVKGAEKAFIAQEQMCKRRLWISNVKELSVTHQSEVKRNRLIYV